LQAHAVHKFGMVSARIYYVQLVPTMVMKGISMLLPTEHRN